MMERPSHWETLVLITLLKRYLQPYKTPLIAVVVLQFLGTLGALYLPTLNADIIDNGVAKGDTTYILQVGAVMLAITFAQVICTIASSLARPLAIVSAPQKMTPAIRLSPIPRSGSSRKASSAFSNPSVWE